MLRQFETIRKTGTALGLAFGTAALVFSGSTSAMTVLDLTHPIPTFKPSAEDPTAPDLSAPWGNAALHPTFGAHAVLSISQFPTNQGYFDIGKLILSEHHGTHLDTSGHFMHNDDVMEPGGIPNTDRQLAHQLGAQDLIGKVVLIDISGRVQTELDKNGGRPSPDTAVTDFSNSSVNVVGPDDIEAVADQLEDGVWLVLNLGWGRFFFEGGDFVKDPYINAFNHPGMNKAAVDKLVEIQDAKGIKINGIIADNIGVDSGQSSVGDDDKFSNSFYAHIRLLQRGLKFVENAANLDQLATVDDASTCTVTVGAPKHIRGTGGPSRIFAICP